MKRIFGFLLTFGLVFSFASEAFAQNIFVKSGAKVRYMIEKKVITQEEADVYATQGYVDLWAYGLFNVGYWEKGALTSGGALTEDMIIFNGSGVMQQWLIRFTSPTQSFMICDKNGDYVSSGSVMFSQPALGSTCGSGRTIKQLSYSNGPQGTEFTRNVCPTYSYGNSPDAGTSILNASNCREYIDIWTDENGVQWYRMKLFEIRYDYPEVNGHGTTFYTRFWSDAETGVVPPTWDGSNGASTFTLSASGYTLKGSDNWTPGTSQDWQRLIDTRFGGNPSRLGNEYGFVIGGVEVISDPEMLLTAEATCGGTDLPGKLTVNDWAEKTWADYSGVKFYVNKTGGTVSGRKQVSAGDLTATIPTTGTAAEIAYTLTPSGYTMPDGSYADSLIWVIEDTFLA